MRPLLSTPNWLRRSKSNMPDISQGYWLENGKIVATAKIEDEGEDVTVVWIPL